MRSKLLLGILWTVIPLLTLAGCTSVNVCCTTLEISTTIQADGSGTKRIAIAIEKEIYDLASLRGEDPFADLKVRATEVGARVEPYRKASQVGVAIAVDFPNLETLSQGIGTKPFEMVWARKSGWRFEETYTFRSRIDTGELPQQVQSTLVSVQDLDFIYRLTLPGEIVSHNANEVHGNTLIWYLGPLHPERAVYELRATSRVTNQGLITGVLVGGLGLVGITLLAVMIWLMLRYEPLISLRTF